MLLISPGVDPITYNVTGEVKATHSLDGTISVSTTVDLPDDAARDIDVGWTLSYVNSKKEIIPCKVVSVSHNSRGDDSNLNISCIDRASFNAKKFAGKSTFGSSTEGHTAKEYFDWLNLHFTGSSSSGLNFNVEYHGSDDTPHYVSIGNSTAADALSAIIKDGGYEAISDGNTIHIYDNISTGNYRVFSSDILMSQCTFEQDASSLITIQEGVGKNGITATYQSPLSDKYGLLYGAPVNDDSIETVADLQAKLQANVEATYAESVTATYANDAGYNLDDAQIGDIINFVDPISGLHIAKRCIQIDYTYDDRGQVSEGSLTAGKPDAAERTAQSLQDLANAAEEYANNTGSDLADDLVSMGGDTGIGDIGNDMYGNLGDAGGSGLNGGDTNGDGTSSDGVKNKSGNWAKNTANLRFGLKYGTHPESDDNDNSSDVWRYGISQGNHTDRAGEGGYDNTQGLPFDWTIGNNMRFDDEAYSTSSGHITYLPIREMKPSLWPRLAFSQNSFGEQGATFSKAVLNGGYELLLTTLRGHGTTSDPEDLTRSTYDTAAIQLWRGNDGGANVNEGGHMEAAARSIEIGTAVDDGDLLTENDIRIKVGYNKIMITKTDSTGKHTFDLKKYLDDNSLWDDGTYGEDPGTTTTTTTTTTTKSVAELQIETIHDKADAGKDAIDTAGDVSGAEDGYLRAAADLYTNNVTSFTQALDLAKGLKLDSAQTAFDNVVTLCAQDLSTLDDLADDIHKIAWPTLSPGDQAIWNKLDIVRTELSSSLGTIKSTISETWPS